MYASHLLEIRQDATVSKLLALTLAASIGTAAAGVLASI
jgi:hypothetical protein